MMKRRLCTWRVILHFLQERGREGEGEEKERENKKEGGREIVLR
jgi:hypothetical protein